MLRSTLAFLLLTSAALAQPPTKPLAFEVASIRPLPPNAARENSAGGLSFPNNRFTMRTTDVRILIQLAYGIDDISGGPSWIGSQLYSVNAKVEGNAILTQKQMQPLLQNLLADRFHLKLHRVRRIEPGYALVLAPGGPKLPPTNGGAFFTFNSLCELKSRNNSVENFGQAVGHLVIKQPVVDKTGLDGMYDFDLKYVPDEIPNTNDPTCSNAPDLFTALQKQLGLKLVPQKVPVESIVIDSIDKPSDN